MEEVTEAQLLAEQNRGAEAKFILEHRLFSQAMQAIKLKNEQRFCNATTSMERLAAQQRMLASIDIERELRHHIDTGKLAESAWDTLKRKVTRVPRRVA